MYGIRISGSDVHPKKWVTELNTDERTHAMALTVSSEGENDNGMVWWVN